MASGDVSRGDFVLASASPRRVALLGQLGTAFVQRAAAVDETPRPGEAPADYVLRVAEEKALAILDPAVPLPVLGADTTVVVDGAIIGKPADEDAAVAILMSLSGRSHQVITGVVMVDGRRRASRLSVTTVVFEPLDEALCRRYWRTGEPADKAGAYAIQGLGAAFVREIHGSYSGVVGLPLADTAALLTEFGIAYWRPKG